MDNTTEFIGQLVSRLRAERNLSQQELSDLSGVPRRTIQNIEHGKVSDPGVVSLYAISKVLKISLDELLGINEGDELGNLIRLFARANKNERDAVLTILRTFVGNDSKSSRLGKL